jgi:hypothetical protein
MRHRLVATVLVGTASLLAGEAHAVSIGQVDTFSASIEGWFAGGGAFGQVPPVPPQVVATGGPAGPGDAFMLVTANGGSGVGSRLVAMNAMQWAGDYTAAGITAVTMDLRNFSNLDLTIRLFLEDPLPGPPVNTAVSSVGILLPAGGDWTPVTFPIGSGDLTVLQGDLATLLTNVTLLRIFHSTTDTFPGEPVVGALGVDNVRAVPEPDSVLLFLLGATVLAFAAPIRSATTLGPQ